jgi:hypothetical protein
MPNFLQSMVVCDRKRSNCGLYMTKGGGQNIWVSAGAERGGAVDETLASILTVSDSQFDAKQKW